MDLGTIGVFAFLGGLSGRQTGELARNSNAFVATLCLLKIPKVAKSLAI